MRGQHTPGPYIVHHQRDNSIWPLEIRTDYKRWEKGKQFPHELSSVLAGVVIPDGCDDEEGLANASLFADAPRLLHENSLLEEQNKNLRAALQRVIDATENCEEKDHFAAVLCRMAKKALNIPVNK